MPLITIQIFGLKKDREGELIDDYMIKNMHINPDHISTIKESWLFDQKVTEIGINGGYFDSPMPINDILKCVADGNDVQLFYLN